MLKIMERKEARKNGFSKYFTGKSCIKGHNSLRYAKTGACCRCVAGYATPISSRIRVKILRLNMVDMIKAEEFIDALIISRELMANSG